MKFLVSGQSTKHPKQRTRNTALTRFDRSKPDACGNIVRLLRQRCIVPGGELNSADLTHDATASRSEGPWNYIPVGIDDPTYPPQHAQQQLQNKLAGTILKSE